MNWFETIKTFYNGKLWTIDMVKRAVVLTKITTEQYKEITNQDYTE